MNQKIIKTLLIIALLFLPMGCSGPRMQYTIKIPSECGNQISPNGEPENKRYTTAYEAFWWQCVKVKSENLEKRCKSSCSGSSCATYGCSEGGSDAESQIKDFVAKYGKDCTQRYLKQSSKTKECKEKTKPYFRESN
jgi:hypothetical protein